MREKLVFTSNNENPFLNGRDGRSEWNDRYLNMTSAIRHWQFACLGGLIIIIIFSCVIAKLAMSSRVQPFVVETNNGMPYAIKPLTTISTYDQRLINFAINQFIINARTIISDAQAEKILLDKVYAFSANNTINFLHDYYQKNNPFDRAQHYQIHVKIVNTLPISKYTWQVVWDEEKTFENQIGNSTLTRWMANVSYKFGEVNPKFMMDNPFGLYITQVSWSQSHSAY